MKVFLGAIVVIGLLAWLVSRAPAKHSAPPQERPAVAAQISAYLTQNFGGAIRTPWYGDITRVSVAGDTVRIDTDLSARVVELPKAVRPDLDIRAAVRGFIAQHPDLGLERVDVRVPN